MPSATVAHDDPSSKPPEDSAPLPFEESPLMPRPRNRFGRIGVMAALVFVVGVVGWRLMTIPSVVSARLVLQGNIDVRQVNLSFKVGGRIETVDVDEGDSVKQGQVLATLDQKYFLDDLRLSEAERDQAAANLDRLKNGSRPEEIESARAQESEQKATALRVEQDFKRSRQLSETNSISPQDLQHSEASLQEARAKLDSIIASRKLVEIGPRKEDIAAGQAGFDAAQARVVVAKRRLEDCTLLAPNDGVILTRAREKGAIVNPGETIFALTLSTPVWVRTYVNEVDLGRIQPGMSVEIVTDTPLGRAYKGHVGFISPTAEFTPKTVETRELRTDLVYRVRIVVDDPDGGLRQGMPITVRIDLDGKTTRSFLERLAEAAFVRAIFYKSSEVR